jgi:hypothetical protein
MANLRGSIGPNGYTPPTNVSVKWRRPGLPDLIKKLRPGVPFNGSGDASVYDRYGEGDPECKGRQITAIGSEQLGGRAFLILKELYAQAGIDRVPRTISEEVWDFAIAEGGDRPMDWCDYRAFTGKSDPICGDKCPPCSGKGGEPIPPGQVVPAPTNLRIEGNELHFDWPGEGAVTFTLYTGGEGAPFSTLGDTKHSPLVINAMPPAGTALMLYATQRKKKASAAQMVVGGLTEPVEPLPPPPVGPPVEPPPPVPSGRTVELRGELQVVIDGQVVQTLKLVRVDG